MLELTWYMVISYLLLFFLLSSSIYFYTKNKSFKYYALYNASLFIYVLSKNDEILNFINIKVLNAYFNTEYSLLILQQFNWYIQVVFYSFYFLFALYFLDLDKPIPAIFKRIKVTFLIIFLFFSLLFIYCITNKNHDLFYAFFKYVFLTYVLLLFFYMLPKAIKYSGKQKYFLLIGISIYIIFALIAFIFSENRNLMQSYPIKYFYTGVIIESICFSLGLAYKIKLINDEKIKSENEIIEQKHFLEISNLNSFIEGEERERNRLAQELHDGINGDLSSIKYQLSSINTDDISKDSKSIFDKIIEMIDYSCQQVRNISHNLSPLTIRDFGLIPSIKNYCSKLENIHPITINFQHFGNEISLPNNIETVIYRIIQELVNNIIKHANATNAMVQINTHDDTIFITVEDNGIGFQNSSKNSGIGLKNIASRIAFLNAHLEEDHNKNGTTFTIHINLKNIPTI